MIPKEMQKDSYISLSSEANTTTATVTTSNVASSSSSHVAQEFITSHRYPHISGVSDKKLEAAIYGHLRAMRALGKTVIDTANVAEALSLPVSTVNEVVVRLQKKGIKVHSK